VKYRHSFDLFHIV